MTTCLKAACWSPDESFLFFACHGCSLLYCLRFAGKDKTQTELQIVCDLSSILIASSPTELTANHNDLLSHDIDDSTRPSAAASQFSLGGAIREMCWDASGQRLAVSFDKDESNGIYLNTVAVFITQVELSLPFIIRFFFF